MKGFPVLLVPGLALLAMLVTDMSSCQQIEDGVNPETLRELQQTEQGITRKILTEGAFWGMRIGDPKPAVIQQLQALGIQAIYPDVRQHILVRYPQDLPRLHDADAIILFPGEVRIMFSGNQVRDRQILPSFKSEWRGQLEAARTRDEVFAVFAEILKQKKRAEFGNYAPGAKWIKPASISEGDSELLEKYDAWQFSHDNQQGFWYVRLEFAFSRLVKIKVEHSLVELL